MSQQDPWSPPDFPDYSEFWNDSNPITNYRFPNYLDTFDLDDFPTNNDSHAALQSPYMDLNMISQPSTPAPASRHASATPQLYAPRPRQEQRMTAQISDPRQPRFQCPERQVDIAKGSTRFSCGFAGTDTMAEVRRHMERKHVPFLKLCSTCNEHFMDKSEFEEFHGYKGEFCMNPQRQRRGEAADAQWQSLYRIVLNSRRSNMPVPPSQSIAARPDNGDRVTSDPQPQSAIISPSFGENIDSITSSQESAIDPRTLYGSTEPRQLPIQSTTVSREEWPPYSRSSNLSSNVLEENSAAQPVSTGNDAATRHCQLDHMDSSKPAPNELSAEHDLDVVLEDSLQTTPSFAVDSSADYGSFWAEAGTEYRYQESPAQTLDNEVLYQDRRESDLRHRPPERMRLTRDVYWSPYNTRDYQSMDWNRDETLQGSSRYPIIVITSQASAWTSIDDIARENSTSTFEAAIAPDAMIMSTNTIRPDVGPHTMEVHSSIGSSLSVPETMQQLRQHHEVGEDQHTNSPPVMNEGSGPSEPDSSTISAASSSTPHTLICHACSATFVGEYRKGNLQRHMRLSHAIGGRKTYPCEAGCGKSFNRQDARLKHYRRRHPELAPGDAIRRR